MVVKKGKLHIAMLGHKRIPSREGGVEVAVEELSIRMVERGHTVVCYNRKGHHVAGAEFTGVKRGIYKGIKLIDVFTINKRGLAAVSSSAFAATIASFSHADIVHIHAEGPAFMSWLPKLCGKKVVVTVHGLDWQRAKWGKFASWYIRFGEKNAVKYADAIIVLSQSMKDYFEKTYNRKTIFIPNGVKKPNKVEAKEIKEKWGLEKDGYLMFLGRLVPEKGVHYLIKAFQKIKDESIDCLRGKKLVIVGGSSDTIKYMDDLKNMGSNVIFTGFQQGIVLEELYSNAYVYVLPSDLEGMPLSLLEAMSFGNCCLVSSIKECTEVVEDKAVIFEKGNVGDLQLKLKELLEDEDKVAGYKNEASDFICNKYSWDDVVERTIRVYKEKLEGTSSYACNYNGNR